MDHFKGTLTVIVTEPMGVGGKEHIRCIELEGMRIFHEREMFELKHPEFSTMSFDSHIEMIKERKFRRGEIKHLAQMLAGQICDYLEDSEGWHGERRKERIQKIEEGV